MQFLDPQQLVHWFQGLGPWAAPVFVLAHIVQVVVFWIPGTPFEVAGGMAFGVVGGTVLSTVGLALGDFAAFQLARGLGKVQVDRWLA